MSGKGRINKNGNLVISRGNTERDQYCMFACEGSPCGDHCPLFGDPKHGNGTSTLAICHGRLLVFDDLKDERVDKEEVLQ